MNFMNYLMRKSENGVNESSLDFELNELKEAYYGVGDNIYELQRLIDNMSVEAANRLNVKSDKEKTRIDVMVREYDKLKLGQKL